MKFKSWLLLRENDSMSLRTALLENPQDELTWQVYADWLEEQGQEKESQEVRSGLTHKFTLTVQYNNINLVNDWHTLVYFNTVSIPWILDKVRQIQWDTFYTFKMILLTRFTEKIRNTLKKYIDNYYLGEITGTGTPAICYVIEKATPFLQQLIADFISFHKLNRYTV